MIGTYKIQVRNARNVYKFELRKNITLLRGESGTGKSTLFNIIHEYNRYGRNSGGKVQCDRPLIAYDGDKWETEIPSYTDSIIVIDEDSSFIRSHDFAGIVKGSSNYFLLITRNYLPQLPYSVDEIYQVSGKGKNKKFARLYPEMEKMYVNKIMPSLPFSPDVIITEDSNSGYQFFAEQSARCGITCVPAGGKSNIYRLLNAYRDKKVLIIADGAAFGAEIADIAEVQRHSAMKLAIFLPESFEWLILKSGCICSPDKEEIIHPELYADSSIYESWERYFTELLKRETRDDEYRNYSKEKLKDFYLRDNVSLKIIEQMPGINLDRK